MKLPPKPDSPKFEAARYEDYPLPEGQRVPPSGPTSARIAVVGQCPGPEEGRQGKPFVGRTGSLFRAWLASVGCDPETVYFTNVVDRVYPAGELPEALEVRVGALRVRDELSRLPKLEAVILVGNFATALALSGSMAQKHGKVGTLFDRWPCIGCYHPSFVARQHNPTRRKQLENSCRTVLARALHLSEPVVLPRISVRESLVIRGRVGLDTETEDIPDLKARMSLRQQSRPDPRAARVLCVGLSDGRVTTGDVVFLEDAEPVVHNAPYDPVVLRQWDVMWHDSKLLAHLCGEPDTELKGLALTLLGQPMMTYQEAASGDTLFEYCVADAAAHERIFRLLYEKAGKGVRELYERIERPMLRLYSRWTLEGVFTVNQRAIRKAIAETEQAVNRLGQELQATLGCNPNSAVQVGRALGLPSTAERILGEHASRPEVAKLREYRRLKKRLSTYLLPWARWPFERLSTRWRPTGAWTGRPSSADLNLQNIPPDLHYLLEFPGWRADFSQIEVRVAAHLSQDDKLLGALNRGEDIHAWAMRSLGAKDRRLAKVAVFATLYGGTETAIVEQASRFGIPRGQIEPLAPELQRAMRKLMPGVFAWAERVQQLDTVPGLFGRKLHVPPHPDPARRQREALNAPIQGGAVDIVKLACLRAEAAGLKTRHMIHDEIFVEGDIDPRELKRILEGAVQLSCPTPVEVKRWGAE